jgi:hypothetical protein
MTKEEFYQPKTEIASSPPSSRNDSHSLNLTALSGEGEKKVRGIVAVILGSLR